MANSSDASGTLYFKGDWDEPTLESVPLRLSLLLQDVYQEQQLNIKINLI